MAQVHVKTIADDPKYAGVLPADFLHGYASAAYQVEGGASDGGRGPASGTLPSRTTRMTVKRLVDHTTCGGKMSSCFNRTRLDRIVSPFRGHALSPWHSPVRNHLGGKSDPVNEEGIRYYDNLINALLDANIEPTITLLHYDIPQALQDRYRGFAAADPSQLVEDFVEYVRICFERFGDRVKRWLTINEVHLLPSHFLCQWGYSPLVGHNSILTHAYAVDLYRSKFQPTQAGVIGIALNNEWVEPIDDSPNAIAAAKLPVARTLGWFADPIFKGTQTVGWEAWGELFPRFSDEEMKLVQGSADFFLINHYGTMYATGKPYTEADSIGWQTLDEVNKTWVKDGKLIGKHGENGHPHSDLDMPIYVYENGFPVEHEADKTLEEIIDDRDRQQFYSDYNQGLCDAVINHGAKIQGYHGWSLLE
ncbi:hypothetical protein A1O1_02801 [Capronia coronata CBS 617.96]|uniref:Beta-glucosidase n=1 Tax=Capronia coronata CBS 617.96 TaxID=1182541 RepID=W9YND2_9EURO|nr:uncharacterized protein A1O1_02801 [Capronia coronata CBS 617.96]EXJ94407.1 hypothetical protein A1O1_02801 [Capronia coronata CBS 617.96]